MSDVTVRRLEPGEERAFVTSMRIPFLDPRTSSTDEQWEKRAMEALPVERAWVAEDSGRFVGQCAVYTMDVTVPAPSTVDDCPVVAMGGVSAVGVHPTHRRRGLLTDMMGRMLEDGRERGEPIAGLIASESVIYGRYGFGLASDHASYRIDRREARLAAPAPALAGLRLLDKDEALKELPALHDRLRRRRAGEPGRRERDWEGIVADEPAHRGEGGHGLFFAACDEGYVLYRAYQSDWMHGVRSDVTIKDLWGATPDIEAALWQFVFDLDIVDSVTAKSRPVDEPLRWRLTDPRKLQMVSVEDRLYVRVLDVAAAFEARGYQGSGQVTFEVVGPDRDPAVGTWVLDAGPDGASCRRAAGEEPGLRVDLAALGSLYLGGFRTSLLAAGGRVDELRPGSLAVADRVLTTTPAPSTVTGF